MSQTVNIEHADYILAKLRALAGMPKAKGQKNPILVGLRAGAIVIRDAARTYAPRDTGNLRSNIVVMRYRSRDPAVPVRFAVGVRGGGKAPYSDTKRNRRLRRVGKKYVVAGSAYYWRFLELGTAKMRARPFLVPALLSSGEKAIDVTVKEIVQAIDTIALRGQL